MNISTEELFHDICNKVNPLGATEVVFTPAYTKQFNRAEYKKELTPEYLTCLVERSRYGENFALTFSIDLEILESMKIPFDDRRAPRSQGFMVKSKQVIQLDLDLKDCAHQFYSFFQGLPGQRLQEASQISDLKERKRVVESIFYLLPVDERKRVIRLIYDEYFPRFQKRGIPLWYSTYSGNGIHLHFYTSQAIECTSPKKFERIYRAIEDRINEQIFDNKAIFDESFAVKPAQCLRLVGTQNWKSSNASGNEPGVGPVGIQTEAWFHDPKADAAFLFECWIEASHSQFEEAAQKGIQGTSVKKSDASHAENLRNALTFKRVLEYLDYPKLHTYKGNGTGRTVISSPFVGVDQDKNPSCTLYEEQKTFCCGCTNKKGDIFKFIAEIKGIDCKKEFEKVLKVAEDITGISRPQKEEQKEPTFDDYFRFFDEQMPGARRCLLSRQLMLHREGMWQPATSRIPALCAHATESRFLNKADVPDYLFTYSETQPLQLLVDIPEWDGVDRIKMIADCLGVKNCSQLDAQDIIKEWGSRVFERLRDPLLQNFILIFKGPQGIGKDFLINAMLSGLRPHVANMTISHNEIDNFAMLVDHLVLNISEFDRTNKAEMGLIKDMTTRHEATIRRAYERSHQRHDVRTSFIASANVDDILRDHTGSRRFIILDVESIDRNYPTTESPQILAQFQALSQMPFRMAPLSEETIQAYMKQETPDNPDELILEEFDTKMENYEKGQNKNEFTYGEISEGIAQIAKNHGYRSPRYVQSLLKRTKRAVKRNGHVKYTRLCA